MKYTLLRIVLFAIGLSILFTGPSCGCEKLNDVTSDVLMGV